MRRFLGNHLCDFFLRICGQVFVALLVLFTVASCGGHAPTGSSPNPSPTQTGYLGIEKMTRGHLASIDRNVLVLWVDRASGDDSYTTALGVFEGIEPMLRKSDIQIVVIKVTDTKGIFTSSASYVYSKADDGSWGCLDDEQMLQKIIEAGI